MFEHLIDYLEDDEDTKVTGLYLESIDRGRKFIDICSRASKRKPFIVIKAGRSEAGTRAVSSHTGSLAGTDRIYDAAFEAAGIIRVKTIGEFFDVARALVNQPPAKGNRIGVITSGGGFGVMTIDALVDYDLQAPELSESLQKRLHTKLPYYYSVKNPVDLTGSSTAEQFAFAMNTLLESEVVKPAPPDSGIKFIRKDITHNRVIKALFDNVVDTHLSTTIGSNGTRGIMSFFVMDSRRWDLSIFPHPNTDCPC